MFATGFHDIKLSKEYEKQLEDIETIKEEYQEIEKISIEEIGKHSKCLILGFFCKKFCCLKIFHVLNMYLQGVH